MDVVIGARDAQQGNSVGRQNPYQAAQQSARESYASAAQSSASAAAASASSASAASASAASTAETTAQSTTVRDEATATATSIGLDSATTATLDQTASTGDASSPSSPVSTADASADTTASSVVESTASAGAVATSATSDSSQTTFETSTTNASAASELAASTATSLHGSQSGDPTASSSIGAASEGSSLLPLTNNGHHQGMSHGAMTAAIVIPILFALLALILAFLCLRRRAKNNRNGGAVGFFPAMREKFGAGRDGSSMSSAAPAPVVTSNRNNAYFTGLDTSSQGSQRGQSGEYYAPARRSEGGTFVDPPPPYKAKSLTSTRSGGSLQQPPTVPEIPPMAAIPALREPAAEEISPFNDPPSPTSTITPTAPTPTDAAAAAGAGAGRLLVSPVERPPTSRSTTNRSFNSDMYSDDASMHSARAARMSLGGQQVIASADPFQDPGSPVSDNGEGEEWHSLTGTNTPRRGSLGSGVSR